jgi:hypothetical protein
MAGELFNLVAGLKPVDQDVIEAFERDMIEHVIPDIVRAVERRRMLAAESRQRQFPLPPPLWRTDPCAAR